MHLSRTAATLVTAGLVSAAPCEKRAEVTDADILNYALTLEHLEDNFYREGLSKYTEEDFSEAGCDATFYKNLKKVSQDESDHVAFLTEALSGAGATPVKKCEYDFGYTDVNSFLATASILEGVGVSAYLGAAADIMDKTYLTAAGSILTVEARHSSYLRAKLEQSPYPQAFDAPLTLNEVYSLASGFIVSCPEDNPALPVKAFPMLTVEASGEEMAHTGDTVTLTVAEDGPEGSEDAQVYAAFIAVTGPTFVEASPVDGGFSVELPEGFAGQTYVVLTTSNESVTDDTVVAGPAIIEISAHE